MAGLLLHYSTLLRSGECDHWQLKMKPLIAGFELEIRSDYHITKLSHPYKCIQFHLKIGKYMHTRQSIRYCKPPPRDPDRNPDPDRSPNHPPKCNGLFVGPRHSSGRSSMQIR